MKTIALVLVLFALLAAAGCEGPQGPEGRGLGSLDDPSIAPAVIYTYPVANSIGPYPGLEKQLCGDQPCWYVTEILVRFNKFMDIASVRRSVKLSSSSGDLRADSNRIGSTGGDYFYIRPVETIGYNYQLPFPVGAICTLQVGQGATDINGNHLVPPYSMTFVPEPYFRVRGFYPPAGITDVHPVFGGPIIYFNSPVDSGIFPYISITPALSGTWVNYDRGMTLYYSGARLDNSTEYTVKVKRGAPDTLGHTLPAPFASSFGTVTFDLTRISPGYYYGADSLDLDTPIYAEFTSNIDSASASRSISVSPATPLRLRRVGNQVEISPALGWMESTVYRLSVDSSLESSAGRRLPRSYEYNFATRRFMVRGSYPQDSSQEVPVNNNISIYTNAPLDTASIRGAFHIEPAVPVSFRFYEGVSGFGVDPLPAFQYQTLTMRPSMKRS